MQLDFDTLKFLDKELFVSVPDGRIREPDLVAEIRTYGGEKELVLVPTQARLDGKIV